METIKELRKICQSEISDTWQDKLVCRRFSIFITRLLIPTDVTPMQVSWVFLFFGFVPGLFLASGKFAAGVILLQMWFIFDGVDGELARYKKQSSLTGLYFDLVIHYISHPFTFICLGIGLFNQSGSLIYLVCAVFAAVSMMIISILTDIKKLLLLESGAARSPRVSRQVCVDKGMVFYAKQTFSFLHKLCTYPTIMNIITLAAFSDLFLKTNVLSFLAVFYGFLSTFVWVSKLIVNINTRSLD